LEIAVEPTLMVVGLNHRTAPVAVRERFWISEPRRCEALVQLSRAEGIEEVIVLATCNRTEFLLWANDASLAANSVLRLLSADYGLKLCEWKHFYRLLDDAALLHIFSVASSLDSMVIGEPQIVSQVKAAWQQAQKVGSTARFLDAVMQKALTVSKRVRNETAIGNSAVSVPYAAVELARQIFGSLENKNVLLLGAGKMSELSARYLVNSGASAVRVVNRTYEHAVELAAKLGGTAIPFDERWQHLVNADIVISSTSCPRTILSRDEAEILTPVCARFPGSFFTTSTTWKRSCNTMPESVKPPQPRRARSWPQKPKASAASCWPSASSQPSSRSAPGSTNFAGKNWSP
jgi:glutamyl-tRNA reductase